MTVWRYASTLAGQQGRWADAVAASEAAMATSVDRTDPRYASLSHARLAVSLPGLGEHVRARRAIDRADEAFSRAGPDAFRPSSVLNRDYARAVLEPLGHIPLVPAGGVSPDNVAEWFDAGVAAVGVGSFITKAAQREGTEQHPVRAPGHSSRRWPMPAPDPLTRCPSAPGRHRYSSRSDPRARGSPMSLASSHAGSARSTSTRTH